VFPILPNPRLKSETGWTGEVGIKQAFKISDWYGFADISGFWSEYTDMLEFTFLGVKGFQSLNIGNTIIKGGEFSIGADGSLFGMPTSLLAGYTYIDPKFKVFGKDEMNSSSADYNVLKYRFKHTIKFDAETQYLGFSFGLSCNYNSNMEAIDRIFYFFIPGVKEFSEQHNKGFTLLGVRLGYTYRSFKASVLLNNLLNEEYTYRPAQLEPPRSLAFRIEYNVN
jgi:iron complex outermembrane receptor protein